MHFFAVFLKDGSDILFFIEGGNLSRNLAALICWVYAVSCSKAYLRNLKLWWWDSILKQWQSKNNDVYLKPLLSLIWDYQYLVRLISLTHPTVRRLHSRRDFVEFEFWIGVLGQIINGACQNLVQMPSFGLSVDEPRVKI